MSLGESVVESIKNFLDIASVNIYLNDEDKAEIESLFQKIDRQMNLYVQDKESLYKRNKKFRHDCIIGKMHKDEYKWLTLGEEDPLAMRKERIRQFCNEANDLCRKYNKSGLFGNMSDEEIDEIAYYIHEKNHDA